MNLLEETLKLLKCHGKTEEDVMKVKFYGGFFDISWENFKQTARNITSDKGFDIQGIISDLVIEYKGEREEEEE
ncbi:MAG TPA: hypothetical protein ENG48_12840 [Candidatus Atribacteria bacterium]|nr:hypothetical protein [Candidatus Atribacteria bacterium]